MKKYFYVFAAFAALLSSVSCNKELEVVDASDEIIIPGDRVVTFEASLGDPTKISFGDTAKGKMPIFWSAGDAFKLITSKSEKYYTDTLKKSVDAAALTDCGDFTTTQDGVATAYFTGTIPVGAVSSTEGIAIYPSSAYNDSSAYVTYNSTFTKSAIGLTTSIPGKQDGTGAKYMIASSRLRNNKFQNFSWATALVKIKVAEGAGVDKIVLSCQDDHTYGIANKLYKVYYYFNTSTESPSSSVEKKNALTSIEVSRDGAEISGDVYFATRNLKESYVSGKDTINTVLTLKFYKGMQVSKTYKWELQSGYSSGKVLAFKDEFKPEFPALDSAVMGTMGLFEPVDKTADGDYFPWYAGSNTSNYRAYNCAKTDTAGKRLGIEFFNSKERTYKFVPTSSAQAGENWTFGSTATKISSINGMYVAAGFNSAQIRMDGTWTSYIKTPVRAGKKLIGAYVAVNTASRGKKFKIAADAAGKTIIGSSDTVTVMKAIPVTISFPEQTQKDSSYYILANGFQPTRLVLYYE